MKHVPRQHEDLGLDLRQPCKCQVGVVTQRQCITLGVGVGEMETGSPEGSREANQPSGRALGSADST